MEQTNTTNTANNSSNTKEKSNLPLISNEPIENTPFRLVGTEEQGYFIALGNLRMTEKLPTKEEVIDLLNNKAWEITVNLIISLSHKIFTELHKEIQTKN